MGKTVTALSGVYTKAYKPILAPPSAAVTALVCSAQRSQLAAERFQDESLTATRSVLNAFSQATVCIQKMVEVSSR